MKFAKMITLGVIADTPTEYKKEQLFLQRAVDEKGDSILVTTEGNKGDKIAYIIPTESLKYLLDEPLESED